jgi:hypothetical protein
MKTLTSILVLLLFISISVDARGPKGGKSIFSKSVDRVFIKPLDLNWGKGIPIVIPDNCKKQLDEKTELTEDCQRFLPNPILPLIGNFNLTEENNSTTTEKAKELDEAQKELIMKELLKWKSKKLNEQNNELSTPENTSNLNLFLIGLIIFLISALGFIVIRFLRKIK